MWMVLTSWQGGPKSKRDDHVNVQFEFNGKKSMHCLLDGQSYKLFPTCTIDREGCSYNFNPKSAVLNWMKRNESWICSVHSHYNIEQHVQEHKKIPFSNLSFENKKFRWYWNWDEVKSNRWNLPLTIYTQTNAPQPCPLVEPNISDFQNLPYLTLLIMRMSGIMQRKLNRKHQSNYCYNPLKLPHSQKPQSTNQHVQNVHLWLIQRNLNCTRE